MTRGQVLVLNTAHTHAYMLSGTILRSAAVGPVELLMPPSATGLQTLWVKIDHRENRCYHVTMTTAIAAGASATVVLSDGRFVSATNWSTDTTLEVGDRCLCFEDSYGVVEVAKLQLVSSVWRIQSFLATGTYGSGNLTLTWNL